MSSASEPKAPGSPQVKVDAHNLPAVYANFCRVIGLPEEVIIDFGLSSDVNEMTSGTVTATERVILSFYTAKRLLEALHATVQRHEGAFGNLEVNIDKRVVPGFRG